MARERGAAWSTEENEAIVADYFAMLLKQLRGESYSKTQHRENLQKLVRRSKGSIEYKHQNISAVMVRLGQLYLSGYLPAKNYQENLLDVVQGHLASAQGRQLAGHMYRWATTIAVTPSGRALQPSEPAMLGVAEEKPAYMPAKKIEKNYLLIEAMNHVVGEAGEGLVLEYERKALHDICRSDLAKKIEHVAHTQGPSAGYDIRSYDRRGTEKWIEVKTTRLGRRTPFFITRNELQTSKEHSGNYWLYRVFDFAADTKVPQFFARSGHVNEWASLQVELHSGREK